MVGNVPLGSDHPIRVQTMTTSDTKDVARTVEEVEKLIKKLPSVPADWSNGDLSSNMKNAMSNDTSLQSIENGSNIRETQSMLLERIARDTLIIKPAKKSPILLRMVMLVFAMVCGVYICSTCLKQISTTIMIKIEDIQVIERPISVNQPDKHNVSSSGKIGYGTVSEALAYKLPFFFVRRDYFNEEPFLRNMLEYYQSGVEMIRRDLLTGHWQPYLERAISLKPCYEGGINGGEVYHFFLA